MTPRGGEGLLQYSVTCQFAFFDRAVNSRQVLINNSARSEIKMADLRVAHLPLRQTDVSPTGAQLRAWIIRVQLVVKGSGCQQRGVSVLVALCLAAWIDAPPVPNNEHHRASHTLRTLPVNEKTHKRFFR